MKNIMIIGVAGGSGSGKTRLVKNILKEINDTKVKSIEVDSYYKDLTHLTFKEREKNNFDHPDAIDFELLYQDLNKLLKNEVIYCPIYNYKTHTREKNKSVKTLTCNIPEAKVAGRMIFQTSLTPEFLQSKINLNLKSFSFFNKGICITH